MYKILIADDHRIVRKGIRQMLETFNEYLIEEASMASDVFLKCRKEKFDAILLDISLPGQSGLEVLKQLQQEQCDVPVLILSMHPEDQYAARAFKAGAKGYLTKDAPPDELEKALQKVVKGGRYVSDMFAENMAANLNREESKQLHEQLSDRELSVFCHLAKGKRISDIAGEMNLSVKTVSTYKSRIMNKMDMGNTAEMVSYAIENKLV